MNSGHENGTPPDLTASHYARGMRVSVFGLVANACLALIKLLTGLIGHSYALVADSIESMADIFSSLVVWGGLRIARQPADEMHPYGHGKAEPLAALFVSLMIYIAGIGIAVQAIRELFTRQLMPASYTIWVLIGVVVVKEGLFRLVNATGRTTGSAAVVTDAWHHRSDAITSGLAAIGLSIALIGGPDYAHAEDWAALLASGIILLNASRLINGPLHELMDAVPAELTARVRDVAEHVPGVERVEQVWARKSGLHYWVDMHIEVDPDLPLHEAHELAHEAKDRIRETIPEVEDVLIHVEPFAPDDGKQGDDS